MHCPSLAVYSPPQSPPKNSPRTAELTWDAIPSAIKNSTSEFSIWVLEGLKRIHLGVVWLSFYICNRSLEHWVFCTLASWELQVFLTLDVIPGSFSNSLHITDSSCRGHAIRSSFCVWNPFLCRDLQNIQHENLLSLFFFFFCQLQMFLPIPIFFSLIFFCLWLCKFSYYYIYAR